MNLQASDGASSGNSARAVAPARLDIFIVVIIFIVFGHRVNCEGSRRFDYLRQFGGCSFQRWVSFEKRSRRQRSRRRIQRLIAGNQLVIHGTFLLLQAERPRPVEEGGGDAAGSRGSVSECRGASSDAVQASIQEPRAANANNEPCFVCTENLGIHLRRHRTFVK